MNAVLTFLILAALLTVAAVPAWTANRSGSPRLRRDQFRTAAPMSGLFDDPDTDRVQREADAIRTRFERHPSCPGSGGSGDQR